MADDWYYAQNSERKGPVPFAKLQTMAKSGWLTPDDLVWRSGMFDWTPARNIEGLYGSSLAARLRKTVDGLRTPVEPATEELHQATPPGIPESKPKQATAAQRDRPKAPAFNWNDLQPRKDSPVNGTFATVVRSVSCMWAQAGR